ncbi:hypothetical protein CRM22_005356 [Opisthorchis felineus]|uniref:Uncharacterized protein n=1 Tax=Opisthorchis felineus TaxID=147828 RepID=A0A4S2LRE8_OPIFE|nr:hypothetical protein CRM22_005356 [Opisthorchis felineus]
MASVASTASMTLTAHMLSAQTVPVSSYAWNAFAVVQRQEATRKLMATVSSSQSASKTASVPIFGGWGANEEQQLLEALEHYGVGNWEDVSLKVETRSPLECMEHYGAYYLDTMLGSNTLCQSAPTPRVTDHTADSSQSTPTMQPSPAVYMEVEDQQLLGYMPARGDFERDYDNDAESILCRLHPSFSYDDLEDALKVAQVGIYMQRLRERQRRKEIAREHGLIAPILAFILNKRLKKRIPWKKRAVSAPGTGPRRRGRPPSPRRHLQLGKCTSQKTTPIKRTSLDSSSFLLGPQSTSPPPGSWLAAPYVLKASGATRGTPLVDSGLATNKLPSRLATVQSLRPNSVRPGSFLPLRENSYIPENYTVFSLNEKLKPFLRYFTGPQGKHFMDNLYREELLKFEIKYLMDCHAKGKVKLNSVYLKMPIFRSFVYTTLPKPILPRTPHNQRVTNVFGRPRKRRRNVTTPWYVKVQRRAKHAK